MNFEDFKSLINFIAIIAVILICSFVIAEKLRSINITLSEINIKQNQIIMLLSKTYPELLIK